MGAWPPASGALTPAPACALLPLAGLCPAARGLPRGVPFSSSCSTAAPSGFTARPPGHTPPPKVGVQGVAESSGWGGEGPWRKVRRQGPEKGLHRVQRGKAAAGTEPGAKGAKDGDYEVELESRN